MYPMYPISPNRLLSFQPVGGIFGIILVSYLAVGTFEIRSLRWNQSWGLAPSNKALSLELQPLGTMQMKRIFDPYLSYQHEIPPGICDSIMSESASHPSSLMTLLRIYYDYCPDPDQWDLLDQNWRSYMNGLMERIHKAAQKDDDTKHLLANLVYNQCALLD